MRNAEFFQRAGRKFKESPSVCPKRIKRAPPASIYLPRNKPFRFPTWEEVDIWGGICNMMNKMDNIDNIDDIEKMDMEEMERVEKMKMPPPPPRKPRDNVPKPVAGRVLKAHSPQRPVAQPVHRQPPPTAHQSVLLLPNGTGFKLPASLSQCTADGRPTRTYLQLPSDNRLLKITSQIDLSATTQGMWAGAILFMTNGAAFKAVEIVRRGGPPPLQPVNPPAPPQARLDLFQQQTRAHQ